MFFKTKREVGIELAKNGQLDLAEVLIGAEATTADAKALNDLGVVNEMKYNSRNALYHYLHAAALGSVEAVFNIGYMYERGSGTEKNESWACQFYNRAISFGYPQAYYRLAKMYGKYEGSNKQIVIDLLTEGSEKEADYPELFACSVELGYRYECGGMGVDKDQEKAIFYYERAAVKGCETAMYNVGRIYLRNGKVEEGMNYLQKAAEKNYPDAYNDLFEEYYSGEHIPQDKTLAFYYLAKARELNSPRARLNYLELVFEGVLNASTDDLVDEINRLLWHEYFEDYRQWYEDLKKTYPDKLDWERIDFDHYLERCDYPDYEE